MTDCSNPAIQLTAYRELTDFLLDKIEVQHQRGQTAFALSLHDTEQMLKLLFAAENGE
jgi:hypothetical protein